MDDKSEAICKNILQKITYLIPFIWKEKTYYNNLLNSLIIHNWKKHKYFHNWISLTILMCKQGPSAKRLCYEWPHFVFHGFGKLALKTSALFSFYLSAIQLPVTKAVSANKSIIYSIINILYITILRYFMMDMSFLI